MNRKSFWGTNISYQCSPTSCNCEDQVMWTTKVYQPSSQHRTWAAAGGGWHGYGILWLWVIVMVRGHWLGVTLWLSMPGIEPGTSGVWYRYIPCRPSRLLQALNQFTIIVNPLQSTERRSGQSSFTTTTLAMTHRQLPYGLGSFVSPGMWHCMYLSGWYSLSYTSPPLPSVCGPDTYEVPHLSLSVGWLLCSWASMTAPQYAGISSRISLPRLLSPATVFLAHIAKH